MFQRQNPLRKYEKIDRYQKSLFKANLVLTLMLYYSFSTNVDEYSQTWRSESKEKVYRSKRHRRETKPSEVNPG